MPHRRCVSRGLGGATIPRRFSKKKCSVVWRNGRRLGVSFRRTTTLQPCRPGGTRRPECPYLPCRDAVKIMVFAGSLPGLTFHRHPYSVTSDLLMDAM